MAAAGLDEDHASLQMVHTPKQPPPSPFPPLPASGLYAPNSTELVVLLIIRMLFLDRLGNGNRTSCSIQSPVQGRLENARQGQGTWCPRLPPYFLSPGNYWLHACARERAKYRFTLWTRPPCPPRDVRNRCSTIDSQAALSLARSQSSFTERLSTLSLLTGGPAYERYRTVRYGAAASDTDPTYRSCWVQRNSESCTQNFLADLTVSRLARVGGPLPSSSCHLILSHPNCPSVLDAFRRSSLSFRSFPFFATVIATYLSPTSQKSPFSSSPSQPRSWRAISTMRARSPPTRPMSTSRRRPRAPRTSQKRRSPVMPLIRTCTVPSKVCGFLPSALLRC